VRLVKEMEEILRAETCWMLIIIGKATRAEGTVRRKGWR